MADAAWVSSCGPGAFFLFFSRLRGEGEEKSMYHVQIRRHILGTRDRDPPPICPMLLVCFANPMLTPADRLANLGGSTGASLRLPLMTERTISACGH